MCGIVGFAGLVPAKPKLLDGLKRLEYRGYDSSGIAIADTGLEAICRTGKVENLIAALSEHAPAFSSGTCGIGHTRWATHGRPTAANAHPHLSCDGKAAIVHNGIIENFRELRRDLIERGHVFKSETDSEVIAHLFEDACNELVGGSSGDSSGDVSASDAASSHGRDVNGEKGCADSQPYSADILARAMAKTADQLTGSYAIVAISTLSPGTLVATRKDSPMVVGLAKDGAYAASDIVAIIEHTREIITLEDGQVAVLRPEHIEIYNTLDGDIAGRVNPRAVHIDWDIELTEKGGYPDFMLKEIYEQPRVIRDTLAGRLVGDAISIDELTLSLEELNLIDRVYIIACGTSYHAGLIAKDLIESWANIPCEVEVASEFRYRNTIVTPTTLVVAVSQSGETADTLAAVRASRIRGARVFAVTNVVGSAIARESDGVIYTKANKEIAVASTKSFLGQVVSLMLLSLLLAQSRGTLNKGQIRLLFSELADTAEMVEEILADTGSIDEAARACKDAKSALFVGRGAGAAVANEGALKLKEISYLHAEAYPAGEMKHGPIALIDEGFPVIAVATSSHTYDKVVSNLQEVKARGAKIVAIATKGDEDIKAYADHVIYVPPVRDVFSSVVTSVPLQLFARSIALLRGCDVDQPRNLAKSVTVE